LHKQTWEPPSNLKNTSDAIQDFHHSHPSAPRPADFNSLIFIPIPAPFTELDLSQIPSWTNGKVETDAWVETHALVAESDVHKSNDGWDTISIDNWNIPEPSKPPSPPSTPPCRPKPSYSKLTDPGHALLHWSFCQSYDCPYH